MVEEVYRCGNVAVVQLSEQQQLQRSQKIEALTQLHSKQEILGKDLHIRQNVLQ